MEPLVWYNMRIVGGRDMTIDAYAGEARRDAFVFPYLSATHGKHGKADNSLPDASQP